MSLDDTMHRACTQAFFDQTWIADTATGEPHDGFTTVLHPGVQQAAINTDLPGDTCDLTSFEGIVTGLNITGRVLGCCAISTDFNRLTTESKFSLLSAQSSVAPKGFEPSLPP